MQHLAYRLDSLGGHHWYGLATPFKMELHMVIVLESAMV